MNALDVFACLGDSGSFKTPLRISKRMVSYDNTPCTRLKTEFRYCRYEFRVGSSRPLGGLGKEMLGLSNTVSLGFTMRFNPPNSLIAALIVSDGEFLLATINSLEFSSPTDASNTINLVFSSKIERI